MRRKNENTKNTRFMQFCFSVLFVFLRVLRFVAIIRFLWCHSFFVVSFVFSVVLFIFPCCPLFVVVRVFRGVRFLSWCCSISPCHSFFCVVDSSALFVFPCCPFFQCSEGVFRVVSFSVLLVFCGVIRFSVQCGGFPRSSFFRVVRLRRVPVPYVRLLATPLPYVRLFFSRDTTLGTCNFSSRVHGEARALRRC